MREEVSQYIEDTRPNWDAIGTPYEMLTPDEAEHRWPWIRFPNLGVAVYEPGAGVVRTRRAIESVAQVFQDEGGTIRISRASFGARSGSRLESMALDGGDSISASTVIFTCGPWFPKVFPQLMGNRTSAIDGFQQSFTSGPVRSSSVISPISSARRSTRHAHATTRAAST